MKKCAVLLLALVFPFMFQSCLDEAAEEEPSDPYARIEGKWTLTNTRLGTLDLPGDGTFLEFHFCEGGPCDGIDHDSDGEEGVFNFEFSEDGAELIIDDTDGAGGGWGFTWDVVDFEGGTLKITTATILGQMTCTFQKN